MYHIPPADMGRGKYHNGGNMGNYVMYLRKSRADLEAEAHGEGETLSRHKTALNDLARRMKITVSAIYEEIVSGETIAARPQMQRLLEEVANGDWDGVLVMEVERLARGDTMDQGLVAQTFKYSNTKIITPLKIFDPSNEFDEEYFEFNLFMARREFTTTNRRLVRGRQASAKEGKYVGSIPPYGYKKVKLENDKGYTLEIIEEQAEVVRMIFDWYSEGTEVNGEKKRLGLHAIALRLNQLGIKSQGKTDYWTIYGIRHMLVNPVYIGKIRWGYRKVKKTVTTDGKRRKLREQAKEGEYLVVDGLHEPIISEELFNKVQEQLATTPPASVKYEYTGQNPLAGLLRCGKCGKALSYNVNKTVRDAIPRVICPTVGCKCVSSKYDIVEKRLLSVMQDWVSEYKVDKKQSMQEERLSTDIESVISSADSELQELDAQLDKVYTLFERGTYTEKVFKQRSETIQAKIADLTEQRKQLEAELSTSTERRKFQTEFVPAVEHILKIYPTLSPTEKNNMLKQVIERIVYEKDVKGNHHPGSDEQFTLGVYPRLPKQGD